MKTTCVIGWSLALVLAFVCCGLANKSSDQVDTIDELRSRESWHSRNEYAINKSCQLKDARIKQFEEQWGAKSDDVSIQQLQGQVQNLQDRARALESKVKP